MPSAWSACSPRSAPRWRVSPDAPKLLVGTGGDKVHLLVVVTADRGLAAVQHQRSAASRAPASARSSRGQDGQDADRRPQGARLPEARFASHIVGEITFAGKKRIGFADAQEVAERITAMLDAGEFDVCSLVYNRFAVGDHPDPDRAAADPGAAARAKARPGEGPAARRRSTNTSRRGGDPRHAAAAQPGDPDLSRAAGEAPASTAAR
jgi:F-type H+-transporting ATPase subunit gamma